MHIECLFRRTGTGPTVGGTTAEHLYFRCLRQILKEAPSIFDATSWLNSLPTPPGFGFLTGCDVLGSLGEKWAQNGG